MDSARHLVGKSPDLGARVDGLDAACAAAKGRLDDRLVEVSQTIVDRVVSRIKLSSDHTVVALAGATGSGKSSTFNALTGMELSSVGVRRPTTSWATACVWGTDGASEILDWLEIPSRHQVSRDSTLGLPDDVAAELDGVVLLDLPDHDSTETSHHLEVDRLIQMADLMIWVLDPQKYADAAIHERYLARLQDYQDVMVVALNHIDRVDEDRRDAMLADVRRLLDEDGLSDVPIFATSALHGDGINALRSEISRRVADKRANKVRMTADIKTTAASLQEVSGAQPAAPFSEDRMRTLEEALADAAGVPTVVEAVRESTAMRAHRATAWPVTAWFTDVPQDPLRRLALDAGLGETATPRTSMPADDAVVKAKVESEVRELADEVTAGLTRPWETAVRKAALAGLPDLNGRLDQALQATDLGADSLPGWAGGVRAAQWALLATGLAGAVWLVVLAGLGLADATPTVPYVLGLIPLPLLLVLVGIGGGLLLALVSRGMVASAASARAQATESSLRGAIRGVTHQLIAEPVQTELAAYETVRSGLSRALS